MCDTGFGFNNCFWIILLIVILCCCCGGGFGFGHGGFGCGK